MLPFFKPNRMDLRPGALESHGFSGCYRAQTIEALWFHVVGIDNGSVFVLIYYGDSLQNRPVQLL